MKLLQEFHNAIIKDCTGSRNGEPKPIYEGRHTLITLGLLDLLCYEGILPFLSVGVGLLPEQRARSVLKVQNERDEVRINKRSRGSGREEILTFIVDGLLLILRNRDEGIAPIVQERCLADLIVGLCELSIGPTAVHEPMNLEAELDMLLERYITP